VRVGGGAAEAGGGSPSPLCATTRELCRYHPMAFPSVFSLSSLLRSKQLCRVLRASTLLHSQPSPLQGTVPPPLPVVLPLAAWLCVDCGRQGGLPRGRCGAGAGAPGVGGVRAGHGAAAPRGHAQSGDEHRRHRGRGPGTHHSQPRPGAMPFPISAPETPKEAQKGGQTQSRGRERVTRRGVQLREQGVGVG